jgi:molybdopterin molybdotransferase
VRKDISVKEAINLILNYTNILGTEKVFLSDAINRVIAEDIIATYNIPPYDNSAMDGFALKYEDTIGASSNNPVKLKIIGTISAGSVFDKSVKEGEAVKIMTGGKIPEGTDCIARKEIVREENGYIYISERLSKNNDLRKTGEDIKKGEIIIKKYSNITPAVAGIVASFGRSYIKVFKKPIVTVLITGDEIVDIDEELSDGQIRNSNGFTLRGLLQGEKINAFFTEIVKDEPEILKSQIENSLNSDIILSTGGVSMGDYDFVKDITIELGFEPIFWRVRVKPGKPLFFARKNRTLFFGIPGNPVSTMSSFYNFILPCIKKMSGKKELFLRRFKATLESNIKRKDFRCEFIRGILTIKKNKFYVTPTGAQGSGILSSMKKGNCFIIVDEGEPLIQKGDEVNVAVFDSNFYYE